MYPPSRFWQDYVTAFVKFYKPDNISGRGQAPTLDTALHPLQPKSVQLHMDISCMKIEFPIFQYLTPTQGVFRFPLY